MQTGKFNQIINSVGNQVAAILDKPNIAMLKKVVDPITLEMFLASEIKKLTDSVNIDQRLNIQAPQIPIIAGQLIELFPVETLEDFVLCFKRGATGFYGSIYRLDAAVLNEWMRAYLEEKYSLIESGVSKAKKDEAENKVDYAAYIQRKAKEALIPPPPPSNAKDNEYERYKLERQPISDEQKIEMIKQKNERIRELQLKAFKDRKPNASETEITAFLESVKKYEIPIPKQV